MLTIIIKGTNGCNLCCSYCSLGEKKNFKYVDKQKLKDIFSFACEWAVYRKEKEINFILHGGEPSLVHPGVYSGAIDLVNKNFPELDISISMQSNGYSVTNDLISFALNYDVQFGISLDGSRLIHDQQRRTTGNAPTFDKVIHNIKKLKNVGINVSCLMVLTKNALGTGYEYLRFFEENHIHLKINPLLNYGEVYDHPELSLQEGDYAHYLIDLYEYSIKQDISVMTSPIDSILRAVLYGYKIGECSFNRECSRHFLCIDYNGDVYPCGKFSDMASYKIGDIKKLSVQSVDDRIMPLLYERRNKKLPLKCNKCQYLTLCKGGCSAEAVIDGDMNKAPILCEDYKMLFDYFHREGLRLLKDELRRQKRALEARQE